MFEIWPTSRPICFGGFPPFRRRSCPRIYLADRHHHLRRYRRCRRYPVHHLRDTYTNGERSVLHFVVCAYKVYFVTVTNSEHAFCVSMIFFHLCLCVCSLSHNLVLCGVKMSNYFSSILFQMFRWFSFFFLFIAILVCRTWFLKKLRLCRRAATLARCKAWFPYRCICRFCRVSRMKKIHRTDRIHSISYNKLYLSFLLY